jgi:hypothetical protein
MFTMIIFIIITYRPILLGVMIFFSPSLTSNRPRWLFSLGKTILLGIYHTLNSILSARLFVVARRPAGTGDIKIIYDGNSRERVEVYGNRTDTAGTNYSLN